MSSCKIYLAEYLAKDDSVPVITSDHVPNQKSEGRTQMENNDDQPQKQTQPGKNYENFNMPINGNMTFKQEVFGAPFKFDELENAPGQEPFPIQNMTPIFAACIRQMSKCSEISDGMVIGPFLTCVSAILLPRVGIMTFYDKLVGVNVFCQTNARASSRKTDMYNPLLNLLMNFDSNRRDHIQDSNRKKVAEIQAWKLKLDTVKKQHAKASRNSDHDAATLLEKQYQQLHLEKPILLPDLRITQSDSTPAAIIQGLSNNSGCGTFLIDEGVLLYQKIVNSEVHHINSAWSGSPIDKTTIRGGNIFIKSPKLASHTFIQPDAFSKIIREKSSSILKDTGYFTRVLICAPNVNPKTNALPDFVGSEEELNKLLIYLKEQITISYPINGLFCEEKRTLTLSIEAENFIQSFYEAIQIEVKTGGVFHEMPGFCGKIAEHIYRIAALLHCIEQYDSDEVSYSTVSAAILLIDWYATEHWRLIVKGGKPLNVEEGADKLLHFLRFRHDRNTVSRITFNDLRHRVECFHDDPDFLDDCVNYLQQRGDIIVTGHRRKGRQGGYRRYEINLSPSFVKYERWQPKE